MEVEVEPLAAPRGSLVCTLLDRRSSVPLAGARVTCVARDGRVTLLDTDVRGNFDLAMPQGVYDFVISARGYLSLFVRGIGMLAGYHQTITRALVPGEGQSPEGEPATALGGFVRDRLGRPIASLTLRASGAGGVNAYTTITDRSGAYMLHGIVPADYELTVRAGDRLLLREAVPVATVKAFVRRDLRVIQI